MEGLQLCLPDSGFKACGVSRALAWAVSGEYDPKLERENRLKHYTTIEMFTGLTNPMIKYKCY